MQYPLIIAHRGYSGKFPENTTKAFREAWRYTNAVETDVRRTADNVLVLHHDSCVDLGGFAAPISSCEHHEIYENTGTLLPSLSAALMTAWTECRESGFLFLEIKSDDPAVLPVSVAHQCIDEVTTFAALCGEAFPVRVILTANDLEAMLTIADEITYRRITSLLGVGFTLYRLSNLSPARSFLEQVPDAFVSYHHSCRSAYQPLFGNRSLVYTVNDPKRARRLFEMGVGGIFTDEVEDMVAVRESWRNE